MAATETLHRDSLDSAYLSSSLSSLSRPRSTASLTVKAYKQATQLYLTKRFKESLEILEPIVTPEGGEGRAAPVTQSNKGTRTKVWVFYLSLLNAIIDLGADEGKTSFGSTKWRQITAKATEGGVWEDVVQHGYGGNEGDVDPDVVLNLATLLLTHMSDQKLNQQRLEAYLSASADAAQLAFMQEGIATPMSTGTSSPKELTTRLKILELYTLHVLPANEEWDYAQQFIEMNDVLDDEHREAFLHALATLKDEKEGLSQRERELEELREREIEEQRARDEEKRKDQERREEERKKVAEAERNRPRPPPAASSNGKPSAQKSSSQAPSSKPPPPKPSSQKKARIQPNRATFVSRASSLVNNFQQMVLQASRNVAGSNMALARFLMFLIAFILLIARRDLRDKLRRAIENGFAKVKQTVGMGTKVSYI